MSQQDYNTLLPVYQAMTTAAIQSPKIPIATFLQEAADLHLWSLEDQQELVTVGVVQEYFDTLPARIGALRHAESIYKERRSGRGDARQTYKNLRPQAIALRAKLQHAYTYAFREREDLLIAVRAIKQGSGVSDLIQDLSDLVVLGQSNVTLLSEINFNANALPKAEEIIVALSTAHAEAKHTKATDQDQLILRNKAFTYFKIAVDGIRKVGQYVYRDNPAKKAGYLSAYRK